MFAFWEIFFKRQHWINCKLTLYILFNLTSFGISAITVANLAQCAENSLMFTVRYAFESATNLNINANVHISSQEIHIASCYITNLALRFAYIITWSIFCYCFEFCVMVVIRESNGIAKIIGNIFGSIIAQKIYGIFQLIFFSSWIFADLVAYLQIWRVELSSVTLS